MSLQDVINEFRSELPEIERLLLGMKPTRRERTAAESYLFTNDALSKKLSEVMGQVNLRFTNGRPVSGRSLTQFLYKIDFITARKTMPDETIERRYFDRSLFWQMSSPILDLIGKFILHIGGLCSLKTFKM